jgi:hypothetical protein
MRIIIRLWRDQSGGTSLIGPILLCTIVALGSIVGLVVLRNQLVQEYGDLSVALDSLSQSWAVPGGVEGAGKFTDTPTLTPPGDPDGSEPAGLDVRVPPLPEVP